MVIKTIIFDLGNVVMTNDWHDGIREKIREFSEYFYISHGDMERGWNTAWPKLKTGEITEEEFWRIFLQTACAKNIDINHAKRLWRKYQRPLENMLVLVKTLSKKYRCVALANSGQEWQDYKIKKYKLKSYFDTIFNSGHVGLAKPDPRIYDFIIQKLKLVPEECIFIDDQMINLRPARRLGMKTILFKNQKDLEKRLQKYIKTETKRPA